MRGLMEGGASKGLRRVERGRFGQLDEVEGWTVERFIPADPDLAVVGYSFAGGLDYLSGLDKPDGFTRLKSNEDDLILLCLLFGVHGPELAYIRPMGMWDCAVGS